jgi:hypothetical protein
VFPKLCVATPWGGAELRQGRRQKTKKKSEKKKLKIPIFYYKIPIPILAFSLTNNFNSSDFYFLLLQLLTTDSVFLENI